MAVSEPLSPSLPEDGGTGLGLLAAAQCLAPFRRCVCAAVAWTARLRSAIPWLWVRAGKRAPVIACPCCTEQLSKDIPVKSRGGGVGGRGVSKDEDFCAMN